MRGVTGQTRRVTVLVKNPVIGVKLVTELLIRLPLLLVLMIWFARAAFRVVIILNPKTLSSFLLTRRIRYISHVLRRPLVRYLLMK